jgi:hypothetical protein
MAGRGIGGFARALASILRAVAKALESLENQAEDVDDPAFLALRARFPGAPDHWLAYIAQRAPHLSAESQGRIDPPARPPAVYREPPPGREAATAPELVPSARPTRDSSAPARPSRVPTSRERRPAEPEADRSRRAGRTRAAEPFAATYPSANGRGIADPVGPGPSPERLDRPAARRPRLVLFAPAGRTRAAEAPYPASLPPRAAAAAPTVADPRVRPPRPRLALVSRHDRVAPAQAAGHGDTPYDPVVPTPRRPAKPPSVPMRQPFASTSSSQPAAQAPSPATPEPGRHGWTTTGKSPRKSDGPIPASPLHGRGGGEEPAPFQSGDDPWPRLPPSPYEIALAPANPPDLARLRAEQDDGAWSG